MAGAEDIASISFTALSGIDPDSPLCYLLEIDGFRILLDCGINELLDVSSLAPLADIAPTIDAVLISHADLSHLGGLPYAVGKLGMKATVYATIPTYKLGQNFLFDAHQARTNAVEYDSFSLDDINESFQLFHQLKYSQHWSLNNDRIQITPYPAGRTLGGSVWRIVKDTEEIVYAVDFNHKSERHLASATLDQFRRPSLLITDAYNGLALPSPRRTREAELADEIFKALKGDGNVLIPVDTAGRALELLIFLEQLWAEERFKSYALAFMSNISANTLEIARSMLEWMSASIMEAFDTRRDNPFSLVHVRPCNDAEELSQVPGPRVVLASLGSLDTGFARDLFVQYAGDPRNRVIFPSRSSSDSLAHKIMTASIPYSLPMTIERRVPLVGDELEQWKEKKRAEIEAAKTAMIFEQRAASAEHLLVDDDADSAQNDAGDGLGDGESKGGAADAAGERDDGDAEVNEDDDDLDNLAYSVDTRSFFEEGIHDLIITPDIESRAMFPCPPSPPDIDDYGEWVDFEELVFSGEPSDLQTGASSLSTNELNASMHLGDQEQAATEVDEFGGEKPTKCIVEERVVQVACRIRYIEFEGRSDARSLQNIIHGISPRKLIFVHGSKTAVDSLVQYAQEHIRTCEHIPTVPVGQPLLLKFQMSMFSIRLDDQLFSSLKFVKVADYELAYLNGIIEQPHAASSSSEVEDDASATSSSTSSRKRIERTNTALVKEMPASRIRGHRPAFIGSVKLSDFKQTLTKAGFQAEFMGSGVEKALVVNGHILLKKPPTSTQIFIEGTLNDDYFKIRELLYAQYTIL